MPRVFKSPRQALTAYEVWLEQQPLSTNTRRSYRARVAGYCDFLAENLAKLGHPLAEPHARDYAVRDYKTHLKKQGLVRPSTVNLTLAALDHFYRFLGLGDAQVRREDLPQQAPRALEPEEQVAFLRAAERSRSARDRAIAMLLFNTGLRVGECAALNVGDMLISARKGVVIVRSGKGDAYREVPLNAQTRDALDGWRKQRDLDFPESPDLALFLNRQGQRLSVRSIDAVVRGLGRDAELDLSPHVLRHTCLTNLVRRGHDLVLVAEIAGHRRLETTRRYSLPGEGDRVAAMEDIQIDY